ncbi:BspA family leucine-rich repeat surface protein [Peptoniphilus sp. EMRHCC_23]|uniref:BspA family leucine-rich repeat surface protein n=1 Tax=Peptoniphilus rachelemmaiella TaxID=2811779 RepID=UPI001BFFECA6|nr:BspA family leucine-rich repeat surface protein [Peptoniphilus rachelemmaiella]
MIKHSFGKCLGLFLCLSLAVAIFSPRAAHAQENTTLDINAFHRAVPKDKATEVIFGKKTDNAPHIQGMTGTPVGADNSDKIKVYEKNGKYYVLSEDNTKIAFPEKSIALFQNYEQLKTVDFADAVDTSKVEVLNNLFYNCPQLESVSLASFDTSQLKNADYLFYGCKALKAVDLYRFDTTSVTSMIGMFNGCSALRTLDLSSFNTSNLQFTANMFYHCENLRTIFATDGFRTDRITDRVNASNMFAGCTSLVGGKGTVYNEDHVNKEYARIDGGADQPGYFRLKSNRSYTITFETNGGSKIGPATVSEGYLLNKPQDPAKADHTFAGWYTDANLTKAYDFASAVVGNMTLYAKWEKKAPTPGTPLPNRPKPNKPARPASPSPQFKPNPSRASKDPAKNTLQFSVKLKIGSKNLERRVQGMKTNGQVDVAPFIHNNRTMLPIRYVAESLGMDVQWINETRTVLLTDKTTRVEIPVDTNKIIVNGKIYESDTKAMIKNDRTYLPIANVARALGLVDGKEIIWNAATQEVEITRTIKLK